jgi:hypothetical protein
MSGQFRFTLSLFHSFILLSVSVSAFYVTKNKVTLYFACIYSVLCTVHTYRLEVIYKSMYFMGDIRDFSSIIRIPCDFGFCTIFRHTSHVRCSSTVNVK